MTLKQRENVLKKTGLTHTEVIKIFKWRKNNNNYLNRAKLYQQVENKALPIIEISYPNYSLLFFFDNAINDSVYASDELQVKDMNKSTRSQQVQLRNRWFNCNVI